MFELLAFSLLGGLAVSYLIWFLLLDIQTTKGFWSSRTQVVVVRALNQETEKVTETRRAVDWSDYIRRIFKVYHVTQSSEDASLKVWIIRPENTKLWVCPYCLSFWVSFSVSWFAFYHYGVFEGLVAHFAVATISSTYIFK